LNRATELYLRVIRPLLPRDRLHLPKRIADDLAPGDSLEPRPQRITREREALGAEIWEGIDAQEYVNELRRESDRRP
jgi:hypothetical protein